MRQHRLWQSTLQSTSFLAATSVLLRTGITEFRLDHHHGRFDVAPLVVVGKEIFLIELEVVPHFLEQTADAAGRIGLEHDVWGRADFRNRVMTFAPGVSFVERYLFHRELLGSRLHKRPNLRRITRVFAVNFDGSYHVGLYTRAKVELDRSAVLP